MNKTTTMVVLTLFGGTVMAQGQENLLAPSKTQATPKEERQAAPSPTFHNAENFGPEAVIWSENFSNGIPTTWVNQGFDGQGTPSANAKWEYRGPSTTPSVNTGSRGAFANANDPITSPTASNGFIIFDSDYLDNGGNSSNMGNGPAPAPHIGTLTTDTIDLTGHNQIELVLKNYARKFFSDFRIAISTDGGTTWPDTLKLFDELEVNAATSTNENFEANISLIAGGQANTMLRFIYDGTPGNQNGNGYYFWMLDDVAIQDLPRHKMKFTDYQGAPAHDIIYDNDGAGGKYGVITYKQNRPINFDSNIFNYGSQTQSNVKLEVDILNASNNSLITTVSSGANPTSVAMLDTANYNNMVTPTWTPTQTGNYLIVYKAVSDSVNATKGIMPTDTFLLQVTDTLMSLDFGVFSNNFGTDNIGDDNSEIGVRLDLVEDERLFGAWIRLSSVTTAGGLMEIEVYDTTGFDFTAGFPTQALVSKQVTITNAMVASRVVQVDLTDANGVPLYLDKDSYYMTVRLFSNAGANPIQIGNDQSFNQPGTASIMYYTAATPNRWYTGFIDSRTLNAPIIRAIMCADSDANCMFLDVEDLNREMDITIGQNEVSKEIIVDFNELTANGVELRITDIKGSTLLNQKVNVTNGQREVISASEFAPGVYILTISNGSKLNTYKLMIQ